MAVTTYSGRLRCT